MEQPSFVIDVRPILENLGEMIELDANVSLPPLVVGFEEFVPLGAAHLVGTLTNTGAGIVLRATLDASFRAECSRCLEEFTLPLSVEVDGFYVQHGGEHGLPDEQEVAFIQESAVDIMGAILSALTLEFPFAPLHAEDCLGICPKCGADRNTTSCACGPEASSSPFSVLRDFFPADE